mmetsp:Transcript_4344/g.12495  ORF Transcript_4344/g.12495 Transcript_4344/m.12495 type:complete len:97 (+) Transcript_4344:176-466(+)
MIESDRLSKANDKRKNDRRHSSTMSEFHGISLRKGVKIHAMCPNPDLVFAGLGVDQAFETFDKVHSNIIQEFPAITRRPSRTTASSVTIVMEPLQE